MSVPTKKDFRKPSDAADVSGTKDSVINYKDVPYQFWEYEDGAGNAPVHRSDKRFRVVMAGRQSGKTMTGIMEISHAAMSQPRQILWWVAPNYKVKDRVWRGLQDFIPQELIVKKNQVDLRLELENGSTIWVKSADAEDSLVSEGLNGVVCDEAGQWKELAWIRGIRPMLTVARGWALFLGTPRGKNWFHRLWLRGQGQDPDWASFHWKTADSPFSDPKELAEAQRTLPRDIYLQEYEANPLDNASGVFRNHRNCVRGTGLAPIDQFTVLGLDLARKLDFTALIGLNGRREVCILQRFQGEWPEQKARVIGTAFRHGARVIADATGIGDVFISDIRQAGVQTEAYILSNQSKQQLIDFLRLGFEQGTISIPADETLLQELDSYQYEYDENSRKFKYNAPEGEHDDMVIALALAYWGQRGVPMWGQLQDRHSESYLKDA